MTQNEYISVLPIEAPPIEPLGEIVSWPGFSPLPFEYGTITVNSASHMESTCTAVGRNDLKVGGISGILVYRYSVDAAGNVTFSLVSEEYGAFIADVPDGGVVDGFAPAFGELFLDGAVIKARVKGPGSTNLHAAGESNIYVEREEGTLLANERNGIILEAAIERTDGLLFQLSTGGLKIGIRWANNDAFLQVYDGTTFQEIELPVTAAQIAATGWANIQLKLSGTTLTVLHDGVIIGTLTIAGTAFGGTLTVGDGSSAGLHDIRIIHSSISQASTDYYFDRLTRDNGNSVLPPIG